MPVTFNPATRQDRISVFSTMEIERTLRFVMWGYAAPTLGDWMDATESLEMYIGSDEQGFAMATWAFPLQGRALPVHFVGARRVFGRADEYARAMCRMWFDTHQEASCLLGITPRPFGHVFRHSLHIGWKRHGEIPCACVLGSGRCVSAVITSLDRESGGEE